MRLNLRNTGRRSPRNTTTAPLAPAWQGTATGWPATAPPDMTSQPCRTKACDVVAVVAHHGPGNAQQGVRDGDRGLLLVALAEAAGQAAEPGPGPGPGPGGGAGGGPGRRRNSAPNAKSGVPA